jgi:hypothetical protein
MARPLSKMAPAIITTLPPVVASLLVKALGSKYDPMERVLDVLRVCFFAAAGLCLASFLLRSTWRPRASLAWIAFACILSAMRLLLFPGVTVHCGDGSATDLLDAYDGGIGTWFWIGLHAAGALAAGRLWAGGKRTLGILTAIAWLSATTFFLWNDWFGGDDFLAHWRT